MSQPNKIRSCVTGQRCLSHYHGTNHPESCTLCRECGYYHEKKADQPASEPAPLPEGNWLPASKIRPMDRVELAGVFHTVTGFTEGDDVIHFDFENIQPQTFNLNTMLKVEKSLGSQKSDQTLFEAVRQAVKQTESVSRKSLAADQDDWGLQVFDWMEGAIRMLKNREWAEQMPLDNAMLCDFEAQISELVGQSTRYTEVQQKFRAAVATLESLGYSYPVDGAEMWRPAAGEMPDYIKWEKGLISGLPPVGAQITYEWSNRHTIQNGKVLGVGSTHIIVDRYVDEGETEEEVLEIAEVVIYPYSEEHHLRATQLTLDAKEAGQRMNLSAVYGIFLKLIKAGKL